MMEHNDIMGTWRIYGEHIWENDGKIGEHVGFFHDFPLNVPTKPNIETVFLGFMGVGLYQIWVDLQ